MEKHLKDVYGFNTFRDHQKKIIDDLLNKRDTFVILPTGGGKSLLYQFPATFTDKITIVISPLISLMNDQCKYLNSKNIKSICLNSETSIGIAHYINYKIIYTTPEFLVTRMAAFFRIKEHIGLFAVDEAHCVSNWSHDFRPSYQKLNVIKKHFSEIPLLAVTATATPRVLKEMHQFLDIPNSKEYILGTRRTNLMIRVLPKSEFSKCKYTEPTIIYVQTRKLCEKLCQDLKNKGVLTEKYHGGMDKKDKERSHELFISGDIMVIVATISFGMGIDKSDIRHVINYGVPANIESYYQEIGRAGRDGIDSKATIYYDENDFNTTAYLISLSKDEEQINIKTIGMNTFRSFLRERNICRQQMIDYYFATGKFASEDDVAHISKCNMCDNCLTESKHEMVDVTEESKIIIDIIKMHYANKGYNVGLKKTISLIKKKINKTAKVTTEIIDKLVSKNILNRRKAGFGFAIGIGNEVLTTVKIAASSRKMKVLFSTPESRIGKVMELRNKLAKKFGLLPATFINDRVIMNIIKKSPKNTKELWSVNGISKEFIMSDQCCEFMKEYILLKKKNFTSQSSSPKKSPKKSHRVKPSAKTKKTRDAIFEHYKKELSIKEISKEMGLTERSVEGHILYIYEHYDADIMMDYFDLTEEKEEAIAKAIKKVGKEYLKPIKEEIGDITYGQIKLYLLVLKIES
jgi:ATP-dependent DNA helicase RecQ